MVLLLAPFFEGVCRKLTARLQSRQGPPLLQPYFDLLKLLGKEDLESGEVPLMQRLAAYLSLTSVLMVACLTPLGARPPLDGAADVILLIYLLGLAGISTLLAGLAAGSTYSLIGMGREMMSLMLLEPLLALALLTGAAHTHSLELSRVLNGSVYATEGVPWSGLCMLILFLLALPAFAQKLPFDITEAETEIMEGPLSEYSGPKLSLFKYAQMIKTLLYAALFIALFLPWHQRWPAPWSFISFWILVAGFYGAITLVAATHARYRIDQALRYYRIFLVGGLGAVALAGFGY